MFRSGTVLVTDEHFETACLHILHIAVYQSGQLSGFGGPIIEFDTDAVKINGSWYMLEICEFRVR